ncbi:MAG: lipopolysaccharide biosynthesis protein [Gammaproteobacteria bacterium]|nr:lipopolysaccharide biosynthesis protein [Gammaproteobacteria bacterium]
MVPADGGGGAPPAAGGTAPAGSAESGIARRMALGAVWMVALRLSIKFIGLISMTILARVLMPADFGLVTLAATVYGFIELLRAFGFDTALIQRQRTSREHYDTAFTMRLIFSTAGALLLVAIASAAARYYRNPDLTDVLRAMAGLFFLEGLTNIGVVEFQKQLTFHKEFMYRISVKLIGLVVTLGAAFTLRNYWALLLGMFATTATTIVIGYLAHPFRPRLDLSRSRDIMGFSSWVIVGNALVYLNQHAQNMILGRAKGIDVLGMYGIAFEFATLTTSEIVAPINRATFPGYAKVANDKTALYDLFLNVQSYIAIIAMASAAGMAAVAPTMVPVVLGEKWLAAVPVLQLLALGSAVSSLNTNIGYVFTAMGIPRITTALLAAQIVIMLGLLALFVPERGAMGAAWSYVGTAIIVYFVSNATVLRYMRMPLHRTLLVQVRPALAALTMGFGVHAFGQAALAWTGGHQTLPLLVAECLLGVALYTCVLSVLWFLAGRPAGAERQLLERLASRLGRRPGHSA